MITIRTGLSRVPGTRLRPIHSKLRSLMKSTATNTLSLSTQGNDGEDHRSASFVPLKPKVRGDPLAGNIGEEMTGRKLARLEILKTMNKFFQRQNLKRLAAEIGIDDRLYGQAFKSFCEFCAKTDTILPELHMVFCDILDGDGHVDDLYPFFVKHAREIFPHLECIDELRKISDLRLPPNWYPEARAMKRKIIFHCGPTNSGKTYQAMERFLSASSGVYCGPLKLLAMEVHGKANERGTMCDLITGEERRMVNDDGSPSNHVACTVEMVSTKDACDVAVIDEIQMVRDPQRGWAWTRALLGIPANEVHICGEEAALNVIKEIILPMGEEIEVHKYERLTKLTLQDQAIESLENVQDGDCIVCFNKNELFSAVLELEKLGREVGVIYGGLPPLTKLAQAKKFNNPSHPCKVLVATDAIGMGLNLSIKRIIFNSLEKVSTDLKGEKNKCLITVSQALQIAGRAGRFNTDYDTGFVTTMRSEDLPTLKKLLQTTVNPIPGVGLQPTADQVELFAYYLPQATLSHLMDVFVSLCEINSSNYFICDMAPFKSLAEMIQHINLPLRARYVFCCSPINQNYPFVCSMFTQFARKYSTNEPVTIDWLCESIGWPLPIPKTLTSLQHLETVFDVLELYLWLSYRFPDLFPDGASVRKVQAELDTIIHEGLADIVRLIQVSVEPRVKIPNTRRRSRQNSPLSSTTSSPSSSTGQIVSEEISKLYPEVDKAPDTIIKDAKKIRQKNLEEIAAKENIIRNIKKIREKNVEELISKDEASGKQSLTQLLVDSGFITPDLVKKLHSEWSKKEKKRDEKGKKK
ncbi:suv3 RNA helicase [Brevipalpus obovatus]|uniref:suv3 RNA helicase n=1 Tax=Brevipalpus obovatus TaxID=246614 RepID=UPI003D9E511D